jgi:hypothetical protein
MCQRALPLLRSPEDMSINMIANQNLHLCIKKNMKFGTNLFFWSTNRQMSPPFRDSQPFMPFILIIRNFIARLSRQNPKQVGQIDGGGFELSLAFLTGLLIF